MQINQLWMLYINSYKAVQRSKLFKSSCLIMETRNTLIGVFCDGDKYTCSCAFSLDNLNFHMLDFNSY